MKIDELRQDAENALVMAADHPDINPLLPYAVDLIKTELILIEALEIASRCSETQTVDDYLIEGAKEYNRKRTDNGTQ
jgi:hypothetical protein